MSKTMRRSTIFGLKAVFVGLLALGGFSLSGCGDEDPCATTVCEFGTCDSDDGQCTNREFCNVEDDCIPGYVCSAEETCVAQTTCTDDSDCSIGECRDGACVNPDSCESDSECLARTYCGQNDTCQPDPCNNVTCQRGVCERGTDKCVSASSCTEETEALDCIAGQKCANGTCETSETFCDEITCERGVCSFAEDGCINAMDCGGDEANCLDGYFCDDMNACRVDLCEQNDIRCQGNGVCVPASGQCQNATSCESNGDCLTDHVCVDNTCRLESVACGNAAGDGGCPGNQSCDYDASNLTASCTEPDVCQTSLDCIGDRQCGGDSCLSAVSCKDDLLEPNNSMGEATVFTEVANQLLVDGSLCQGDTDLFSFTTTDIVSPTTSGTIVVEVNVPERDLGLGTLTATLNDPDGNEVDAASVELTADNGSVQMTTPLGIPDHGTYSVSIQPGDQMSSAGLTYEMGVNVLPQETVDACADAQIINSGQRVSGTTEGVASTGIGGTCLAGDESSSEKVYALQIDRSREVTVSVNPVLSTADATVALRSRCLQPATEVACVDDNGEGGSESLTEVLSPGLHHVVVQAPADSSLGNFELTVESSFSTTCGPDDNYCSDGQTAQICTASGGQFGAVSCDAGCQPSTGECFPPAGDRCLDAPAISPETAMGGEMGEDPVVTREIDLRQLSNDYELQAGGCLSGEPRTGGPEKTYEITLPAKTAVTVDASFANEVQGSLYISESCSNLQTSCAAGAQGSVDGSAGEETLTYSNLTDQEQTRYLVVDTAAEQNFGAVNLTMSFKDVICTPAMQQCSQAGNVETCNDFGTAYDQTDACGPWPCNAGDCGRPDTCATAINATSAARATGGVTYSDDWSAFNDDISGDDTCGGSANIDSIDTDGRESVYQLDMMADDLLQATLSGQGDFSLYIKAAGDCGVQDTACFDAMEEEVDDPASVTFQSGVAQTVYLVAEREREGSGSFTLDISLQQPVPACQNSTYTPQCDGSGNLQYCSTEYPVFDTYTCQGGCMNATCGSPTGAQPFDPKPLSDGGSDSNSYVGSNAVDPVGNNNTGSCSFNQDTAGADWTYEISLQANETLTATFTGGSCCDIMYLLKDPFDGSTCQGISDNDGSITYTAGSSPETVYVIMDHDSYTNSSFYSYNLSISIN